MRILENEYLTRRNAKCRRNAKWFGAERFYTDRHQMYDNEELDAIFIITGPGGHYASEESYLKDFAIHHFDIVRHFMGDIETVYAVRNLTDNQAIT